MKKNNMSENWEIYCDPQTKDEKIEATRKVAEDFILENLDSIKVSFSSEDGEAEASLSELETAVKLASTPELQAFLKTGCIPFEDGTIVVSVELKEKTLALCEGRHEMPDAVEGAIFGNSVDPLDVDGLEKIASEKLAGVQHLRLYVTGLTVALVAVINVCHEKCIKLTLMHFDRGSGNYYQQMVK